MSSDKSILGYFKTNGYTDAYNVFLQTLQQTSPSLSGPEASHMEMLDKKWSSIIRMNKKIMELEAVNSMLKEDLENAGKGKKMDLAAVLPREPAKLTLKGHRDGVRAVKFHPVYSLIATASEDATIKVWCVTSRHAQSNDVMQHRCVLMQRQRFRAVAYCRVAQCLILLLFVASV